MRFKIQRIEAYWKRLEGLPRGGGGGGGGGGGNSASVAETEKGGQNSTMTPPPPSNARKGGVNILHQYEKSAKKGVKNLQF